MGVRQLKVSFTWHVDPSRHAGIMPHLPRTDSGIGFDILRGTSEALPWQTLGVTGHGSLGPTLPPWVVVIAGVEIAVGSLLVGRDRQYAESVYRWHQRHGWFPMELDEVRRGHRLVGYVGAGMGVLLVIIGLAGLVGR